MTLFLLFLFRRPRSGASERPFSASSTSVYHRSDIIEEDLPSRRDLLAQVGGAPAETLFFDREIERAALLSDAQLAANPLRSHHLWSKKSLDMFKRMYKYTDNVVPEYGFLQHYCKGDALGVVDTYLTYENSDHIENFTSYWAHFQQRFEIHSKVSAWRSLYTIQYFALIWIIILSIGSIRAVRDRALGHDAGSGRDV